MQLVNQPCTQVLANGGYAAAEAHVAAVRGSIRPLQCDVDAFGDKTELRSSRHP